MKTESVDRQLETVETVLTSELPAHPVSPRSIVEASLHPTLSQTRKQQGGDTEQRRDDVLAGELRLHQGCVRHETPEDDGVDGECREGKCVKNIFLDENYLI